MADMNIMGKLDFGKPQNQCGSEPEMNTEWTIKVNGELKSIQYKIFCSETKDTLSLASLEKYIREIIVGNDEYKKLPPPRGGYD